MVFVGFNEAVESGYKKSAFELRPFQAAQLDCWRFSVYTAERTVLESHVALRQTLIIIYGARPTSDRLNKDELTQKI